MRFRVLGPLVVVALTTALLVGSTPARAAQAPALVTGDHVVGMAAAPTGNGYWLVTSDGGVYEFGDAANAGSLEFQPYMGMIPLNSPIVGMAATPDGKGYWLVAGDGGVFAFGDADFYGSVGGLHLNAPIVGMAATGDGKGYWLAAADGGVFAFGDAQFSGSLGDTPLSSPVTGISAFPDQSHYWLVTAAGTLSVFGFSSGSWPSGWADISSTPPNAPFVAVANAGSRSDFGGVWLEGADGGVFALGTSFYGSMGGVPLAAPMVGMAVTPSRHGYWLVARDGGVFAFGDAPFLGALAG